MENVIYDEQTEFSRLYVAYDRWNVRIIQWTENCNEDMQENFVYSESFMSWENFWKRNRSTQSYNSGKTDFKSCIVDAAISFQAEYGVTNSGFVSSLNVKTDVYGCEHIF